jgi:hypothetical protein
VGPIEEITALAATVPDQKESETTKPATSNTKEGMGFLSDKERDSLCPTWYEEQE